MKVSRRSFLSLGGSAPFLGLCGLAAAREPSSAHPDIRYAKETTTICPYCAVGCGQIVQAMSGQIVNIEGDPDHPINEGSLCSKGASTYQIHNNERRLRRVLHRKPGGAEWRELSWEEATKRIAELVKKTRDETWVGEENGLTVNRAEGIACLGGAALDTEECYLVVKAMRALGVAWIEHQARI